MTRIRKCDVMHFFNILQTYLTNQKIKNKFIVSEIKAHPEFNDIPPSKIGSILDIMSDDYHLIEKSDKIKSGQHYVRTYIIN